MVEKINIGQELEVEVLVNRISTKLAKNGTEYQQLFCRDKDGIEFRMNHFDNTLCYQLPIVIKASVRVEEYLGNKTYTTKSVECSNTEIKEFMPKGSIDVKKAYAEIVKILGKMRPSLSRIVCGVILKEPRFKTAALNSEGAYARPSGVLEATYRLVFLANKTSSIMVGLDKDLMIAGAMLYYIGCIDTVTDVYTETEDAILLGDLLLTQEKVIRAIKDEEDKKVDKKGNELPPLVPQDTKMLLNILNAGASNYGTATFPEATALRYLSTVVLAVEDQMDALKCASYGDSVRDKKGRLLYKAVKEEGANGVS